MKLKLPENLAKTLMGIVVILAGAGVSLIPVIGSMAGTAIIAAGSGLIIYGVGDKIVRADAGKDPWSHEKALIEKLKG